MQYITNEELCRAQSNAISLDNLLKTLGAMDSPDGNAMKHCKLQLDRYDALFDKIDLGKILVQDPL